MGKKRRFCWTYLLKFSLISRCGFCFVVLRNQDKSKQDRKQEYRHAEEARHSQGSEARYGSQKSRGLHPKRSQEIDDPMPMLQAGSLLAEAALIGTRFCSSGEVKLFYLPQFN